MMSRICILTDSSAQFPSPVFPGHEHLKVIPLQVLLNGQQELLDAKELKITALPPSARNGLHPQVLPPSVEDFKRIFAGLGLIYDDLIVILLSGCLNPAVRQARAAVQTAGCPANIHVIDSLTISAGLGYLVQAAAEFAVQGVSALEITHRLRGMIPHTYTLFCTQSLTYLYHAGQVDIGQALVGEMLGVTPFFLMENGRLVPVQKARTTRHIVDLFYEFISEFANLRHIVLLRGLPQFSNEVRILHERIQQDFASIPFSEHTLNLPLATLIGPRTLGLVAIENQDSYENRHCYR